MTSSSPSSILMKNFDLSCKPTTEYTNRGKNRGNVNRQMELLHKNRSIYTPDNLNECQKELFDYTMEHPHDIILLQAGPGSGKTFTLLTLAYTLINRPIYTIIFKNDLLVPFECITKVYSVAQFFMELLKMNYMSYINFAEQLSARLARSDYIKIIAQLLSMVRTIDLRNTLIFIDEYTVINKSLLFVLLIIFKHYRVGCVISGDKNQLQTIGDSKNTKSITSFGIVRLFADKVINFTKNERCGSAMYNEKINLVSSYSINKKLDDFGYALVSAILFENLYGIAKFNDTFLASTHRSLSIKQHTMVVEHGNDEPPIYPAFYMLDTASIESVQYPANVQAYIDWGMRMKESADKPKCLTNSTIYPFKFLAYLPLQIGAIYYVYEFSESCLGKIIHINQEDRIVTLQMLDSGDVVYVRPSSKFERVIFEEHLQWLKSNPNGTPSKILNYPIYPARFMTIHRCQGCTITDRINIDLIESTYQALYVAMSRIKNQSQLISITIPKQLAHALTVIVNFEEYSNPDCVLSIETIKSRLTSNYHMYRPKHDAYNYYFPLVLKFIAEPAERQAIRQEILNTLKEKTVSEVIKPLQIKNNIKDTCNEDNEGLITLLKDNVDILKRLSVWPNQDRMFWLHEWMRIHREFISDRLSNDTTKYTNIESLRMLNEHTGLKTLPLNETCEESIRKQCNISSIKNAQLTIEENDTGYVQAASYFQKQLYDKLKNRENPITERWLLNTLVTINHNNEHLNNPTEMIANQISIKQKSIKRPAVDISTFKGVKRKQRLIITKK
uniref:XcpR protein n=1 Tax=Fopius arisanus TaxID=64838 RepID=A0A0C9QFT6_9HYME